MPLLSARRQAEPEAIDWFQRSAVVRMVEAVQRESIPELARVFGHDGLYLRPAAAVSPTLSGNLLANVLSLYRRGSGWDGDLRCDDAALPLISGSQSLAYAAFVLESAREPEVLLSEILRTLKPEGVLLLLTLSPWSLLRMSWLGRGLRSRSAGDWAALLGDCGFAVERQRALGPYWLPREGRVALREARPGWMDGVRSACLTVARRREAGVTPIRWAVPGLGLAPGVGADPA